MDLTFIYGKEMIEKCIYLLGLCFSKIKKTMDYHAPKMVSTKRIFYIECVLKEKTSSWITIFKLISLYVENRV